MSDPREDSRAGSLAGLLVVSIEQAVAAPLCTDRLADAGARVIKIERPEGETARHYDSSIEGMSAYFVWLNRGKESAALDLKAKEDLALLHRLVAKADIFVQNLAPGAIDRLGLSRAALVEKFPRLISVHIVGYGQNTPYADMRAYDMLVQAESGVCAVTGSPDTPSKVGVSVADIATGMNAHAAVLEALFERERTNRGQAIEVAMFDGMRGLDGRSASPSRIRQARDRPVRSGACVHLSLWALRVQRRSVRHCRNSAAERVASVLRRGPAAGRPFRRRQIHDQRLASRQPTRPRRRDRARICRHGVRKQYAS
jgi:crotonobetainyl-CoA:carnitine CoA-transferase CaiB-like acyl-CoA transferase